MNQEIINQDCLTGIKKLDNGTVHLTWTSPPYYNAKAYSEWATYEDYLDFLREVFTEVSRVLELVDKAVLETVACNGLRVRVSPWVQQLHL
jgi:DNA modification methylase